MITITVPAYNEEEIIEKFIRRVEQDVRLEEDYELLIVNDGSRDKTKGIVERLMLEFPNLRLVNHPRNKGLGAALRTGFKNSRGRIIITMDSDLTHPPKLVRKLVEGTKSADVCIASRYVKSGGMKNVPGWRVLVSIVANRIFAFAFGSNVRDITAGFKAYRVGKIKKIGITKTGFEVQMEIMIKLIKRGATFNEIPLILVNRKIGKSKFSFLKMIPKYAFNVSKLWFYRWFGK
ncbi:MAG TPA: glycosyltransferase [Candidatus Nanoarchaeia archaeon]|nr:glycosyltransferase [Candidatus Nanoarchaeia archaeon]